MIEKVVLKNIKCHLDSTLEFGPGFNVIAGESDEGKSQVYRAIRWVLENRPLGWNPKPWSKLKPTSRESRAEVHFSDGNVIARVRTASKNFYELNGENLGGAGSDVPEQVKTVINMNDSNSQPQSDMFFLLNSTAGAVAKKISEVADLGVMTSAMKEAESRVKSAKKELAGQEKIIEETLEKIDELKWVPGADEKMAHMTAQEQANGRVRDEIEATQLISDNHKTTEKMIEDGPDPNMFIDFEGVKKDMTELKLSKEQRDRFNRMNESVKQFALELQSMMPTVEEAAYSLNEFSQRLNANRLLREQLDNVVDTRNKLLAAAERVDHLIDEDVQDKFSDLSGRLGELGLSSLNLTNTEKTVEDYQDFVKEIRLIDVAVARLNQKLESALSTMEVCPLCKTDLT